MRCGRFKLSFDSTTEWPYNSRGLPIATVVPFANEAEVLNIGQLSIENRLDRITLSGALDVTHDQAGLALARQLQDALAAVINRLESESLPEHIATNGGTRIDNPFA